MDNVFYSSLYGELTKNVQIRIDAAAELRKQLFDQVLYENYLDWDNPTIGLDFEEIIGSNNITIAAATIGENGNEPVMGTEGLATFKNTVLNHAITIPMKMKDYRKLLELTSNSMISNDSKKQALVDTMFKDVTYAVNSVRAKLDYMFLEALSNKGVVTLDSSNNPEGGIRCTIDYGMDTSTNLVNPTAEYKAANSSSVDVMQDIQNVLDKAADRTTLSKILVSPQLLSYICKRSEIKKMIFGSDKSTSILTPAALNQYLESLGYPTFQVVRRIVRMQSHGTITEKKPWNVGAMVFIPDGKLGVIKNAYADNELKPEEGVSYSNAGRIRISQWAVGETQASRRTEFTKAQCYALPVITEINNIYHVETGLVAN